MSGGGYTPLREDRVVPFNQSQGDDDNNNPGWRARFDDTQNNNNNSNNGRIMPEEVENHGHDPNGSVRLSLSDERVQTRRDGDNAINRGNVSPSSPKSQSPYHPRASPSTKYTALRPTSVRQLATDPEIPEDPFRPYSETDGSEPEDLDFYDSQVRLTPPRGHFQRISRFHIILSGLLLSAVAVIGFGLLYVFVLLPSHRGTILSPGGKAPTADIIKLKHLGPNVAVTSCGLVRGTFEGRAHVFRGIPYAAPPTGHLRWKAPVPRSYGSGTCWKDVLNTTSFGSVCAQPKFPLAKGDGTQDSENAGPTEITGSEDCLYMNVWTPSLNPPEFLPVFVWIHSGDLVYGSGHATGMTPTAELAAATNAVYVSFNYRLGVFGFLALDALREKNGLPHSATGNYGIMDQLLALQWVKENARHFGGDFNKITVFGHGSGATSIQALLLSAKTSGLFNSAWLTSPVALLNKTLDEACEDNQPMITRSGCSDADCLRRLDTAKLVQLSPWSLDPHWTSDRLLDAPAHSQMRNDLAIFDGHVVHRDSIKHGPSGQTVPVVVGATYSDLSGLVTDVPVTNLTWDQLNTVLVHELEPLGTEAVVQIKSRYSQMSRAGYSVLSSPMPANAEFFPLPSRQFSRFLRDIQVVCPSKMLADKLNTLFADTNPIYLYISEAFPSHDLDLEERLSVRSRSVDDLFIGWDMVAFFGSFRELGYRERQADISFQDIVRQELLSLAKSGKPNAARWRTEGINTGLLRSAVTVFPAPENYFDSCDVLRHFGFFHYTWADNK